MKFWSGWQGFSSDGGVGECEDGSVDVIPTFGAQQSRWSPSETFRYTWTSLITVTKNRYQLAVFEITVANRQSLTIISFCLSIRLLKMAKCQHNFLTDSKFILKCKLLFSTMTHPQVIKLFIKKADALKSQNEIYIFDPYNFYTWNPALVFYGHVRFSNIIQYAQNIKYN